MGDSGRSERPEFHYDRDERLRQRGRQEQSPKGGLFRRNRSLTILLLDIVLILVLYLVLQFFVFGVQERHTALGCRFVLRAVAFEDDVLVTLRITRREEQAEAAESPVARAVFRLDGSDTRGEDADLLPSEVDEPRYLRARLPRREDAGSVTASVEVGGRTFELSAPVEQE
jgi:hypothetical protein